MSVQCLFCGSELDALTKPEHILMNALGGRKTSRQLICSTCNETFGSTIDAEVARQVATFRNHLHLVAGDGKPPPGLSNIAAGDDVINMRGDGTLDLVQKPFEVEQTATQTTIRMQLRSLDEVARYLPHVAAKIGVSVEDLVRGFEGTSVVKTSKPPDTIHFTAQYGGVDFLRSVIKSGLELWATVVGNAEVRGTAYEEARDFVVNGGEAFNLSRIEIDSRLLPAVETVKAAFGPVFNLIYVRSDVAGRVLGHFTLYNILGWQFVLAERGGVPNMSAALASNPLDPRQWSDQPADVGDVPIAWLEEPSYASDFQEQAARFSAALGIAHSRRLNLAIQQIVEQEFAPYLSDEPVELPDDLMRMLIARISQRAAHLFLRIEHNERLTPEQVESLIRDAVAKAGNT